MASRTNRAAAALAGATALLAGCGGTSGSGAAALPPVAAAPAPLPGPTPTPATGSIALTGATSPVHDPAILAEEGRFYLFTTGNGGDAAGLLGLRTSDDLKHWTLRGGSYAALPAWAASAVPGATGMWAPDISKVGSEYRLYYSISTFGSNRSAIGLATASVIDPTAPAAHWVDRGPVVRSDVTDDYNAIDPNAFTDADGRSWLVFGSFWSGIKLIELDPATGKRRGDDPLRSLAARPSPGAIEAPFVIRHGGFYYLFVSFDFCCRGAASSYNTMVGRSATPTGPYVDRAGTAMLQGGGTPVLASGQGTGDRYVGRGHAAILQRREGDVIVYHAYDTQRNGTPTLQIQPLAWDAEGWPVAR
ncbi:arabinan endo-1,5-alpha-L-arabinosidase [Sphingomonas sp. BK069]|uniref:arabinan endo-1,5-alpha-L-arabinosidase n=1 Tax=Sphingomonas sp. BK069 TaxID=2586979 RepID=UPI00161F58DB|nr:arabinan endo-1,5-alpha-L-arabinosidase [Sphingomonas sp. BK069]MBB3347998.1 arabinan endo-1,5-alpha-L-arabinosidase [Sphingomonas sp. BK069]